MHAKEDLIARLLRRYPHFPGWATDFAADEIELVALQFAVIDRYGVGNDRPDLTALYRRFQFEVAAWVSVNNRAMRMPTESEFDRARRLHLPMISGIAWWRVAEAGPLVTRTARRARRA